MNSKSFNYRVVVATALWAVSLLQGNANSKRPTGPLLQEKSI
jgi:hypothetical protein